MGAVTGRGNGPSEAKAPGQGGVLDRADAVVIGGGILGTATAYALTEAGVDVVLLERGQLCGEASGANLGWLTLSTKPPGSLLDLARLSMRFYAEINERIDRRAHFTRAGGMTCARTEPELAAREELTRRQVEAGLDVRMLTPKQACQIEPILPASRFLGAAYGPDDCLIYPFAAVLGLARAAARAGARIYTETRAVAIRRSGGAVEGVETPAGAVLAPVVVNCAGAWAAEVGAMAGAPVPVEPCRGQVMVTERTEPLMRGIVMGFPVSLRQAPAGNVMIGSTKEFVGEDKRTVLEVLLAYGREALRDFPALRDLRIIRTWAGLRPASPDDLPILGAVEGVPGYYVVGGAFRNGMMYGPALGRLAAQLITGRQPELEVRCLSPMRFWSAPAPAGTRVAGGAA